MVILVEKSCFEYSTAVKVRSGKIGACVDSVSSYRRRYQMGHSMGVNIQHLRIALDRDILDTVQWEWSRTMAEIFTAEEEIIHSSKMAKPASAGMMRV